MTYVNKIANFLGKWIIISAGVITGLFSFIDMFEIEVNIGAVICIPVIFSALFLGILMSKKKIKNILMTIVVLSTVVFVVINIKAFINGIYSTVNSILDLYMFYYSKESVTMYELKRCSGLFNTVKQFNTLFFGVMAMIYSYILTLATSNKLCSVIHIALSATFLVPGMILGEFPNSVIVSVMISYYLACFMFKGNKRVYLGRLLALSGLCAIIIGIMVLMMSPSEYYSSGKFERNKERIDRIIENMDVDTIFQEVSDFILGDGNSLYTGKAVGGISGGELGSFDSVKFKNVEMLKARFQPSGNSIYLKGYACNEYMGDHWDVLSEPSEEAYLDAYNRYVLNPAMLRTVEGLDIYRLEIEYIKDKNEYRYVPYMSNVSIEEYYHDLYAKKQDEREYGYKFASFSEEMYSEFLENTESNYNRNWEFYQEVSMGIPDNIRELFDEILVEPVYYDGTPEGLDKTLTYVKNYLNENTEYSLSPGKLKAGDDFVVDFLTVKKKGYCTAYASTAVLMFRYLGIPARYAEGYLISSSDYSGKEIDDEGYVTLSIKDSSAHAWPEIFLKGIGFMPVEVTPAYIDDFDSDVKETPSTTEKKDSTTKPTEPDTSGNETTSPTTENESKTTDKKSGRDGNNGSGNEQNKDENNNVIIIVAILVVLLISSIIVYRIIENKKASNYKTDDLRHNIKILSDMFVKYLLKLGIEFYMDSNISEIVKEIDERISVASQEGKLKECKYITGEDTAEILDIIFKAKYSGENIQLTEEEYQKVRQYVEEFKKSLQYLKNKV